MARALRAVGSAVVEGEVQKPKKSGSGALWFSLTDGDAVLPCKVFGSQVRALQYVPSEGDLVQVEVERPDLWAQAGKLDLIVNQIRLAGEGELLRRRQELIDRFRREGLCDPSRRRPLPRFPRAVGVIAGASSEAMSDVVRALIDRWPSVHIVTCASLVQGKRAPRDLIDALARMTEHPLIDVVVMARGGGSVQDLACFDDEGLCRALFACELPVVCAIGHTDNNPVCNHVAWPAYTPSRSAELVVPSAAELRHDIAAARSRLDDVPGQLALNAERVERAVERMDCPGALDDRARDYSRALDRLLREARAGVGRRTTRASELVGREGLRLSECSRRRLEDARRDAKHLGALIAAHDFRRRGWLLAAIDDGTPVRSTADLCRGQRIGLRLHDGQARAVIETIDPDTGSHTP